MSNLKEDIEALITTYFDKKTQYVDWHYDISAEQDVKDIVKGCIEKVVERLEDCEYSIDEYLERFEEGYSGKSLYEEDIEADYYYRTRDLINEERRQL